MAQVNGVVLWAGPSQLDGAPIVVIATGLAKGSNNEKTGGGLIQTWIMREDMSPTVAINTGADASICGSCPHRGTIVDGKNKGRSCYVTVFQAPLNVWKTYKRGGYPTADIADLANMFAGRGVRLGSYGDPAAVPIHVWEAMLSHAAFWTGYTHQWRIADQGLARFTMASCDSENDRTVAKANGWRTFRVRTSCEPVQEREIICPASAEAGYKTVCDLCRACGGLGAKAKADVVIVAHGAASKVNAFNSRTSA